jgi:hypothetical protein
MNKLITSTAIPARAVKIEALANLTASFESFCLPLGSWLWSSSPSRPVRLLILLHLNATRCPQLHRQARRLGSPSNLSHRPRPRPNRAASPGAGMRVPPAWRRWRRGVPRNAKPNCAKDLAPVRAGHGSGGTTPRSGQLYTEIMSLIRGTATAMCTFDAIGSLAAALSPRI